MIVGERVGTFCRHFFWQGLTLPILIVFFISVMAIGVKSQECSQTHNVEITHIFNPGDVYLKPGECVRFVNIHNNAHSAVGLEREFNTGILMPGSTATLSFDKPIIIPYTCGVHPPMVGVIVVTDGAPSTSTQSIEEADLLSQVGDPVAGKKVFNKCKVCHLLEKDGVHRIGPNLFGVLGRKSGTTEGYQFSKAMRKAGIIWDRQTLSQYLKKPRDFIIGTKMAFAGLKNPKDVQDVVAFIEKHTE